MSTQQSDKPASLAHGAPLSTESWADFVARLHHDCVGEGVRSHCTADAIFKVESRERIYGIDKDYTDKLAVIFDDSVWFSPQEYWDDLDEEGQAALNRVAQRWSECDFLERDEDDQWEQLGDLDDHRVTGWDESWEYVCSHFTKDAAEAFIKRKRHDYREGMRVYVDAQTYCWEYNTIKEGILQGRIGLTDEAKKLADAYEFLATEFGKVMYQAGFSESTEAAKQDAMSWLNQRPAVDEEETANGNPD
ncbi:TPA: hypothetical protein P2Q98_001937 [Aeromonas veronii]|uniref:hypothetical protein n=1 Tax=Aeromonas veronii TaxID=654 RepID=UPI0033129019|nr:hypothetical protein [Aeromonas veronii]HDO1333777.1 hypothetical protein [Aeromonas veronii]HDO1337471.1 hypothetical protein [Aeromonas veronii]HDO1342853.1 hypothetical protein [Aeromonas veronii]HDO1347192.1 hypothetical protein [Aeromonas veronii]